MTHRESLIVAVFVAGLIRNSLGLAQEGSAFRREFSLEPVVLDSEETGDTDIGISFHFDGDIVTIANEEDTGDGFNPNVTLRGFSLDYSFKGTLTQSGASNPENFVESSVSPQLFRSAANRPAFKTGGFVKYETDQDLDDRQLVYGGTFTLAKIDVLQENDYVGLDFNLGQVDPAGDASREAVLGPQLDSYTRADFELLYVMNLGNLGDGQFDTFEFNYRYFRELSPDQVIEDARMDNYKYAVYRLGFGNNLFVAYATGKLPFDQTSDQVFKIGFSYALK